MDTEIAIRVAVYVAGVALRVAWPYFLKYLEDGTKFDPNYLIGQIIGAIIGLFGVMASGDFLVEIGAVGYFGALVLGYGAASIGRDGQKTASR